MEQFWDKHDFDSLKINKLEVFRNVILYTIFQSILIRGSRVSTTTVQSQVDIILKVTLNWCFIFLTGLGIKQFWDKHDFDSLKINKLEVSRNIIVYTVFQSILIRGFRVSTSPFSLNSPCTTVQSQVDVILKVTLNWCFIFLNWV